VHGISICKYELDFLCVTEAFVSFVSDVRLDFVHHSLPHVASSPHLR
jgi:hypothetical protein